MAKDIKKMTVEELRHEMMVLLNNDREMTPEEERRFWAIDAELDTRTVVPQTMEEWKAEQKARREQNARATEQNARERARARKLAHHKPVVPGRRGEPWYGVRWKGGPPRLFDLEMDVLEEVQEKQATAAPQTPTTPLLPPTGGAPAPAYGGMGGFPTIDTSGAVPATTIPEVLPFNKPYHTLPPSAMVPKGGGDFFNDLAAFLGKSKGDQVSNKAGLDALFGALAGGGKGGGGGGGISALLGAMGGGGGGGGGGGQDKLGTMMLVGRAVAGDPTAWVALAKEAVENVKERGRALVRTGGHMVQGLASGTGEGFGKSMMDAAGSAWTAVTGQKDPPLAIKFGKAVFEAAEKLKQMSDAAHEANMKFAEFSSSMARVQANQVVVDINYQRERGEARSASAQRLADARNRRRQEMAPIEDWMARTYNSGLTMFEEMWADMAEFWRKGGISMLRNEEGKKGWLRRWWSGTGGDTAGGNMVDQLGERARDSWTNTYGRLPHFGR